jgi:PadR family transcriptional regulator PadR
MPGRRHRRRGGRARGGVWFLEPVLLLLLHHGPAHGYTMIERLGEFGLEGLHPSVAYRALRDMDEKDWVTSSWDVDETQGPPRRVYRLTALGDEVLGAYMQDLRQAHEQIGDLMDAYHRHMEEGKGEHH